MFVAVCVRVRVYLCTIANIWFRNAPTGRKGSAGAPREKKKNNQKKKNIIFIILNLFFANHMERDVCACRCANDFRARLHGSRNRIDSIFKREFVFFSSQFSLAHAHDDMLSPKKISIGQINAACGGAMANAKSFLSSFFFLFFFLQSVHIFLPFRWARLCARIIYVRMNECTHTHTDTRTNTNTKRNERKNRSDWRCRRKINLIFFFGRCSIRTHRTPTQ